MGSQWNGNPSNGFFNPDSSNGRDPENYTQFMHSDSFRANYLMAAGNVSNQVYNSVAMLGQAQNFGNQKGGWSILTD